MKPLLIISLFFCSFSSIFSQYVLPTDKPIRWSMEYRTGGNNPDYSERLGYYHEMRGDTLINDIHYQKVYQKDTWWHRFYYAEMTEDTYIESGNFDFPEELIGFIRQDSVGQKVYFKKIVGSNQTIQCVEFPDEGLPPDQEILIFDFDMTVGEEVFLGYPERPHLVEDSVTYDFFTDGVPRTAYNTNFTWLLNYFVEDFGSDAGLFGGALDPQLGLAVECHLNCVSIDGNYILGNSLHGCDSIDATVPTVDIENGAYFKISPNPFKHHIQMEYSSSLNNEQIVLSIYDARGLYLSEHHIRPNERQRISTTHLAPGIYILTLRNDQGILASRKLVKI